MRNQRRSTWRRISALLPQITVAIAVIGSVAAAVWIAVRMGWL